MKNLLYCILTLVAFSISYSCKFPKTNKIVLSAQEKESFDSVRQFIKSNWVNTIRTHTKDSSTLIGLPKPYTVPSINGMFQEMYYWDTYFTNVGLILEGNVDQAKNNCDNMLFMVNKYGYMLNGNRTFFLNRSQPPYLSMMIRDVFSQTKDINWLKECLPGLEKEYNFWMSKRISPIGLNHFSNSASDEEKKDAALGLRKRLGKNYDTAAFKTEAEMLVSGSHALSECESGWDFNPRFINRCEDFCPIDLNCNLYMYEKNFAFFNAQIQSPDSAKWTIVAEKRKALINKYMYNATDSLFYDYDFVNQKKSPVYSAAIFNLLWSEIATPQQAKSIADALAKIEFEYGVSACAPGERKYSYQWDYPNGWANLQYLAVKGLRNYGYEEDAGRIAYKFVRNVTANFQKTNNLWEKYNITDGTIKVNNEYEMPTMMGWTAGVFVYLSDYLSK